MSIADPESPLGQRFWTKVDAHGVCWEWTASRTFGYGSFYLEGKYVRAHRASYLSLVGPVPEGLELDHLCRNRACVNPDHLEPVTRSENTRRGAACFRLQSCRNGHPRSAENTYTTPNGTVRCRPCDRERGRRYSGRKRAELDARGLTSRGTPRRRVLA